MGPGRGSGGEWGAAGREGGREVERGREGSRRRCYLVFRLMVYVHFFILSRGEIILLLSEF